MNPLLHFGGLPQFDEVKPEHVTPAIDQLLEESRGLLVRLEGDASAPSWDSFVRPLEDAEERLGRAWSQVSHLNSVVNTSELRETYNANLAKLTAFYADLSQNEALYAKYKLLRASPAFADYSPARKKIVENELRDFRLGGAELPSDKKARFKAIQEEMSTLWYETFPGGPDAPTIEQVLLEWNRNLDEKGLTLSGKRRLKP